MGSSSSKLAPFVLVSLLAALPLGLAAQSPRCRAVGRSVQRQGPDRLGQRQHRRRHLEWRDGMLVCTGKPIGVMCSEKQYENFVLHIEWMHMEPGGNSGVFVWSAARPDPEEPAARRLEVQMLELDWPKLHIRDGVTPPVAYVHGELFGVGGVKITPDNPRGERSKSIENRALGRANGTPTTSSPSTAWSSCRSTASSSTASPVDAEEGLSLPGVRRRRDPLPQHPRLGCRRA